MNYKEFFTTDNKSGWKTREDRLKNNYLEIYSKIINYCDCYLELNELPFKEKIWHFINESNSIPKCNCGNKVKFKGNLIEGYNLNCSLKCSANNNNTKEKNKITSLKKYGVEHSSKAKLVRDKYKSTCESKYGVNNVSKLNEIKNKVKNTTLKNHGVECALQLPTTREKLKEYSILKYGVDHLTKSNEVKKQVKETLFLNHGVTNPMYSKILKEKQINSLFLNHGVTNPMKSENIRNKCVNNGIQTKFKQFISRFDNQEIDDVIDWSGDSLVLNCNVCKKNYTLSRELFILRNSKNKITCLYCNPLYKKDSYGENEIETYIKSILNINIETNNRKILNGKELDIYIPSHNLAIEFNGLYWHSECHVDKNYHLNKTLECEKQGIKLIHIFEDEWLFKQDIVKSRLMNILGLTPNKIFARKTKIKEVSIDESKIFLETNHIQGSVNSSIKLGLYLGDELVSLMTFGNGRIIMSGNKNEYELLRFCNKLNTSVVGGADKLLKYFIKTYHPKQIISYADRRWSQGGLYDKLGFTFIHNSKPNYYYIINNKRCYRFKYRKDMLIKEGYDINKSEHDIMLDRGIYRIYDCGAKRYELNINNYKICS